MTLFLNIRNGKYALIEIKLGSDKGIAEGLGSLQAIEKRLDEPTSPVFKMIITANGHAYRTEDGIYIVPIGCKTLAMNHRG